MTFHEIKELLVLVKELDYTDFELSFENTFLRIGKGEKPTALHRPEIESPKVVKEEIIVKQEMPVEKEKAEDFIVSPIVGTFYDRPSPNQKPYVAVGSKIKKGDTLCIIEAMKLMNEVVSDKEGTILEILIENEEMVEYNQPLFKIG